MNGDDAVPFLMSSIPERENLLAHIALIREDIKNLREQSMTSMAEGFINDRVADALEKVANKFEQLLD